MEILIIVDILLNIYSSKGKFKMMADFIHEVYKPIAIFLPSSWYIFE